MRLQQRTQQDEGLRGEGNERESSKGSSTAIFCVPASSFVFSRENGNSHIVGPSLEND